MTTFTSQRNRGVALLISIIIAMLVVSIGVTLSYLATKELSLSGTVRDSELAYYAAQTGADCAKKWTISNPDYFDPKGPASPTFQCNGGNVSGFSRTNNISTFTFTLSPQAYKTVITVEKYSDGHFKIKSKGYNTDTAGRKVERGLTMILAPKLQLCGPSDKMLAVDISGSIREDEVIGGVHIPERALLKAGVDRLVDRLTNNSFPAKLPSDTALGAVFFKGVVKFPSTTYLDSTTDTGKHVKDAMAANMPEDENSTNLAGGIRIANYELNDQAAYTLDVVNEQQNLTPVDLGDGRNRPNDEYPNFLIILSDGANKMIIKPDGTTYKDKTSGYDDGEGGPKAVQAAIAEANAAKISGTTIFTIGIGNKSMACSGYLNCEDFLEKAIAGPPDDLDSGTAVTVRINDKEEGYAFYADSFVKLQEAVDNILNCEPIVYDDTPDSSNTDPDPDAYTIVGGGVDDDGGGGGTPPPVPPGNPIPPQNPAFCGDGICLLPEVAGAPYNTIGYCPKDCGGYAPCDPANPYHEAQCPSTCGSDADGDGDFCDLSKGETPYSCPLDCKYDDTDPPPSTTPPADTACSSNLFSSTYNLLIGGYTWTGGHFDPYDVPLSQDYQVRPGYAWRNGNLTLTRTSATSKIWIGRKTITYNEYPESPDSWDAALTNSQWVDFTLTCDDSGGAINKYWKLKSQSQAGLHYSPDYSKCWTETPSMNPDGGRYVEVMWQYNQSPTPIGQYQGITPTEGSLEWGGECGNPGQAYSCSLIPENVPYCSYPNDLINASANTTAVISS